jgi:hypothetical protein
MRNNGGCVFYQNAIRINGSLIIQEFFLIALFFLGPEDPGKE